MNWRFWRKKPKPETDLSWEQLGRGGERITIHPPDCGCHHCEINKMPVLVREALELTLYHRRIKLKFQNRHIPFSDEHPYTD